MPPKHRDISPFLQLLRDFLLGRKHVTCLRHAEHMSSRDYPPPAPLDPALTRLSGNPYYQRDARSQVKPPIDLIEEEKRKLAAKAAEEAAKKADPKTPATPAAKSAAPPKECKEAKAKKSQSKSRRKVPILGRVHNWD